MRMWIMILYREMEVIARVLIRIRKKLNNKKEIRRKLIWWKDKNVFNISNKIMIINMIIIISHNQTILIKLITNILLIILILIIINYLLIMEIVVIKAIIKILRSMMRNLLYRYNWNNFLIKRIILIMEIIML